MTVTVIGPKNRPRGVTVDTTSRASGWSQGLSPFFLGPVDCYAEDDGVMPVQLRARNVENAWQYSKVYAEHVLPPQRTGGDHEMLPAWFDWRDRGFAKDRADRYPMGKGRTPLFSYWNGKRFSYVEARKAIYIPLYASAVKASPAFTQLVELYKERGAVTLWDFDGYNHRALNMSYDDVVNCGTKKMGHAFVLAMLLEGVL